LGKDPENGSKAQARRASAARSPEKMERSRAVVPVRQVKIYRLGKHMRALMIVPLRIFRGEAQS